MTFHFVDHLYVEGRAGAKSEESLVGEQPESLA